MFRIGSKASRSNTRRSSKTCNQRHRFGSWSYALLLPAAKDEGRGLRRPCRDEESTDPGGPITFVRREAEIIGAKVADIDRDLSGCLCSIAVEDPPRSMNDCSGSLDGLDDTRLVVHKHDRGEKHITCRMSGESGKIKAAVR